MKETTFKGVKLTDEEIVRQMQRFDAELRDKFTAWGIWAVEHDSTYYPPKKLLSMATGIDVDEFNGGESTNSKFRELDFNVVQRTVSGSAEGEQEIEEAVEASLSLERDLENALIADLGQLEPGLQLFHVDGKSGRQFDAGDAGRMDLLCLDQNRDFVVLELKAGEAGDKVCSQILRYMGWLKQNLAKNCGIRGIIIANEFTEKLKYAVMPVPTITLKKYDVRFQFTNLPTA